ncbi:hypothetical protein V1517DRAFT_311399 [Lipomyces orientalis]|uniref:Uncharacterized protein n=1 Tax=Lipomyces orientalis TaxID=1233043 RepID=A0ACC3TZK4_9ASCO
MVSYSQVLQEAEARVNLPEFNPVGLFGDSIRVQLPEGFVDASDFRQIPDNQEVFVASDSSESSDNSIIIELVERLESDDPSATAATADINAVRAHYDEISSINSSISRAKVLGLVPLELSSLPQNTTAYMITGTQIAEKWGKNHSADLMYLVLTLAVVRLPDNSTDVLISFNSAVKCSEQAVRLYTENDDIDSTVLLRIGLLQALCRKVVESLEVVQWGLFAG